MGRLVVGVDANLESRLALEWAVEEARRRGDVVHAVHAQRPGFDRDDHGLLVMSPHARRRAVAMLRDTIAGVAPRAVGVEIITEVVPGRPGPVLVRAAVNASLLVLGEPDDGPFRVGGSVVDYVMKQASCPVVVVPFLAPVNL